MMTPKQAKEWLNRNYRDFERLNADIRFRDKLAERVNQCIGQYESDGSESHDPERSKAHHEDMLLEYSEQKRKVEDETIKLNAEDRKTRQAIAELRNSDYEAVATDRYINRLKWEDIFKPEHRSKAQTHRTHGKMLEAMAKILTEGGYV